jgi:Family of unknown function (DUF6335)
MVNKAKRSKSENRDAAIRREAEAAATRELQLSEALESKPLESKPLEPDLEELEDLETELGMEEVELDQATLETIAADTTADNLDADDDGIDDETDDHEVIDDRPQAFTESYGTGLQGKPSDRAGRFSRRSDSHLENEADPILTGGDIDANYEQASVVGDEAVGGTVATPDQDIVDDLGAAVGLEMDDRAFLRTNEILEQRDDRRWELDPKSAEDYGEHRVD